MMISLQNDDDDDDDDGGGGGGGGGGGDDDDDDDDDIDDDDDEGDDRIRTPRRYLHSSRRGNQEAAQASGSLWQQSAASPAEGATAPQ